ncbi:MAG: U32 family peptidase [Lentisphaerae bacterium]|nr:U32 family peptidase [Lentisphaerota bacterium]
MKDKIFRPELLAPAGNLETAVAAFNAGADAVYLGLGKFNARNRAQNFKREELERLLEFAHNHNRKVYVTLNTLIAESELPELFSALAELSKLPVDAVIVQDLGVLFLLRRYFPHITVHASTQMNVHNSCGVKALELLGVKRVILERQITGEELSSIASRSNVELEVFVHGSLCISLSGRCLLSHYSEDASGNRGMCRQLCRRSYRSAENQELSGLLSPRDLQLIEQLPLLSKLKIASLKIEGRLRGPDYVVPVVKAYRQALDALPERSAEAVNAIKRTLSRPAGQGAWKGFDQLLYPQAQTVFGRRVGEIKASGRNGLTVQLCDRIHLGDKLRIVSMSNTSLAGFELTEIFFKGSPVSAANAPAVVTIPGSYPETACGETLYKIGENGYDYRRQAAALPAMHQTVLLDILLDGEGLHITAPELPEFEFHSESFPAAERCAVTAEDLQSVFTTVHNQWRGRINKLSIDGRWFCAKSVLKTIKRELFNGLIPYLQQAQKRDRASEAMLLWHRDYKKLLPAAEQTVPEEDLALPGFIAEGDLPLWRKEIRNVFNSGGRCFSVGSIGGVILLKEALKSAFKDVYIIGRYPLPAANSQAVRLLKYMGVKAIESWVELPAAEREKLLQRSTLAVLPPPENCELLATRAPLKFKQLLDRRNTAYQVRYDRREKLYKLFAPEGVSAAEKFLNDENF